MSKQESNSEAGFTLVELMIATIVFTVILLGTSTALIQIGRMYYKGIITSRTQETSRNTIDSISRQIQFGGDSVSGDAAHPITQTYAGAPSVTVSAFCIGNQRFSFIRGPRVSDAVASGTYNTTTQEIRHVLWRDTLSASGNCEPLDLRRDVPVDSSGAAHPGTELLGNNMRLKNLGISTTDDKLYSVTVDVIYGDNDLINFDSSTPPVPQGCKGILAGSQWCAQSALNTNVIRRLR